MAEDCVKYMHHFSNGGIPCSPEAAIVPWTWKTEFLKYCDKLIRWRKDRAKEKKNEKIQTETVNTYEGQIKKIDAKAKDELKDT